MRKEGLLFHKKAAQAAFLLPIMGHSSMIQDLPACFWFK